MGDVFPAHEKILEHRKIREDRMREQEVRAYRQYEKKMRRRQVGVFCFHLGVTLIFFSCCIFALIHKPEPDVLTVVKGVPVEVTVAPDVSEDQDGPSDAAVALARTMWGEARGCSTTEQAAVAWCVLNRVDSPEFPDAVEAVCSQRTATVKQFDGYDPSYPVEPELLALAEDVLARWELEQLGVGSVGRVLPADYFFFEGDGVHNSFRRTYIKVGQTWDWSLPSPYED